MRAAVSFGPARTDNVRSARQFAREITLMKKSRFGVEQIVGILKEEDAGATVGELFWKHAVEIAILGT